MENYPETIIYRHRKEKLKKCSLRGLEQREDMHFFTYPVQKLPSLSSVIVLAVDAPPLTVSDSGHGLLLIDGTWRLAEKMLQVVPDGVIYRSLPSTWKTAYPRRQDDCKEPKRGLASVEALFAAYHILERDTSGLLDHYHWREDFLKINNLGAVCVGDT